MASRSTPSAVIGAIRKVSADCADAVSSMARNARIASLLNSFSGTVPRARAPGGCPRGAPPGTPVLRPGPVQVEQDDLARGADQDAPVHARAQLRQAPGALPGKCRQGVVGPQHPVAMVQDDASLVLDELVVLPCVPVDLQVDALGDALRVAKRPVRS